MTIKYKIKYDKKEYLVTIDKPKNTFISIVNAHQIFFRALIKKTYRHEYKELDIDKKKLDKIKIKNIREIGKVKQPIFNY